MADIHTDTISFPSNGGTADGFIARPADDAQHPAIIVIQEWWGLNETIKAVARRFAHAGFVALAPDLYHGTVALYGEPNDAQKAAMALDEAQVVKDLRGAIQLLRQQHYVAPKRVGTVGFCMGGRIALTAAHQFPQEVGAAVGFYPAGYDPAAADVAAIGAPVLVIFAADDHYNPPELRDKIRQLLTDSGKTFDMVTYQGADHAFFNDDRPEVFNQSAADDAWQRTLGWFQSHLR